MSAAAVRAALRDGSFGGSTERAAPDHVQANLVVVPRAFAADLAERPRDVRDLWREDLVDPQHLGIADLLEPDYGDPPQLEDGDVPAFWGCGVTPQSVIVASRLPFAITHEPGHMFVTDLLHADAYSAY